MESNTPIFPNTNVLQNQSVAAMHTRNMPIEVEVIFTDELGIVSAIVKPRNRFRVYPNLIS